MPQLPKNPTELFDNLIPLALQTNPTKAQEIDAIYLFKVNGGDSTSEGAEGGEWTVDLKATPPSCRRGDAGASECRMEMDLEDFHKVLTDPNAGMQLYFAGKLRVTGDPVKLMRVARLFELARPV